MYSNNQKVLAMKQTIKTGVFALALILVSFRSFTQEEQKTGTPKWVSEKGYWVVESNIHSPLENTVRFYNNDNVQIYKETISGTKINFKRAKVKMKLKDFTTFHFSFSLSKRKVKSKSARYCMLIPTFNANS